MSVDYKEFSLTVYIQQESDLEIKIEESININIKDIDSFDLQINKEHTTQLILE